MKGHPGYFAFGDGNGLRRRAETEPFITWNARDDGVNAAGNVKGETADLIGNDLLETAQARPAVNRRIPILNNGARHWSFIWLSNLLDGRNGTGEHRALHIVPRRL